jgi:outer membrane protein TolC
MTRWIIRRWMRWVSCVVLTTGTVGCVKPLYMTPETQQLANSVSLPADLATNPGAGLVPDSSNDKPPATVNDSTRPPRYITLQEAFALAMERGTVGSQFAGSLTSLAAGGRGNLFQDDLTPSFRPIGQGDDAIRAFALDPAIAEADIEGALSKFDARLTSTMNWQKRDQAVANIFNNFNNGDLATFSSALVKPLPTGGITAITLDTSYTKLQSVPAGFSVINPSYTPAVTFNFEQPLLKDNGIDINQLLPSHPGSTQLNVRPSGGRTEGILVTRIRTEQARYQFERQLNLMILNVESTYWQLYSNYFARYAAEQAVRQGYITWEQLQDLHKAGLRTKQEVAQARAQLEEARNAYIVSLQQVLETERQLRGLLGMTLEDGQRLVPADTPTLAPYKPDWNSSLAEALTNRPELISARQELKVQQFAIMVAQNNTRPDLRFFANYNVNSIGDRLDGRGPQPVVDATGNVSTLPGSAFKSLIDNNFNNWGIGFRFDVPLGTRDAHSQLRAAQLGLARTHVTLSDQERKAQLFLGSLYQQIESTYEQIQRLRDRRIALGTQLEGQFERVKIGRDPLTTLLEAQRFFAQAIQQEHQAIANYNIAIAGFQYAKGAILTYNNITISEGALPAGVSERAVDHFTAKSAALVLRERRTAQTELPQSNEGAIPLLGLVQPGAPKEMKDGKPAMAANASDLPATSLPVMPVGGSTPLPMAKPDLKSVPMTLPPIAGTTPEQPVLKAAPEMPVSNSGMPVESAPIQLPPSTPVSSFRSK